MGGSSSTTNSSQNSTTKQNGTTAPWEPTQPLLNNIIGGLTGQYPNAITPSGRDLAGIADLQQSAGYIPDFTNNAVDLTGQLFTGGQDFSPIVNNAYSGLQGNYNTYQGGLQPYLNPNYLDPTKTPGMANLLATIQNDVGNSVNSQFAGAGRDLSGMNQQSLARGIAQGEAAPLLNQYNQNVAAQRGAQNDLWGAGTSLYNAGNTTAQALSGLQQTALGNKLQGMGLLPALGTGMANPGANAMLSAEATARGLPLNNMGLIENLLLPIAGLGKQFDMTGTTNSTGTSTTQNQASPLSMIASGVGILGRNGLGII